MKKKIGILIFLAVALLMVGCASKEKTENEMYIYYLNADGNTLIQEIYPKKTIENAIQKLNEHSVVSKQVKIQNYVLKNGCLELYFGGEYYELDKGKEVLLRAAIVQTMVQFEDVNFVTFFVDEHPMVDGEGTIVGMMRAEDFVQNTGLSIDSYQTTDLTLYFSNKDGTKLKEQAKSNVRYNANTSIERLVVEQIMKGTSASGSQSTIPKTTMLLGVSVKDEICYVNFDSKLSTDSYDLDPEVTIYSIVNSVIANSTVTKVQILIDGASDVVYKSKVDLSRPLERNLDLIKE